MYAIAVFFNRTQALQYAETLRRMGVNCNVINTPREITTSCGLSVMFLKNQLNRARVALNSGNYPSFKGFYLKNTFGKATKYEKIG